MPTWDLAEKYRTKTDEELLQLAMDSKQLTPQARTALTNELTSRRIDVGEYLNAAVKMEGQRTAEPWQASGTQPVIEHRTGEFIADVLRVYHRHLRLFVGLSAPAVVISYVAVTLAGYEVREIAQRVFRSPQPLHYQEAELLEIWAINLVCISWQLFGF